MKKFYATLAMLFVIVASMAQPREIKGVVHDENDKPMSGVTVYVAETGAGTPSRYPEPRVKSPSRSWATRR